MTEIAPRRYRAAIAVATLTVLLATVVVLAPQPAWAAPEDQPGAAEAAAAWIAAELDEEEPDFDAFGVAGARTDVLLALASTGTQPGASRRAYRQLQAVAADYAASPGAVAKVLLAARSQNEAPTDPIEGRDLDAELRSMMGPDGTLAGDVFNHSLAMLALAATQAGVPGAATDALVSLQCQDGGFSFSGDCADGTDVDATALATQALLAGNAPAAAAEAAGFLVDAQRPDGSFPNAFGAPNANSAGVAGQALRAAGETAAADLAAEFVMSLQLQSGPDAGGMTFTETDDSVDGFATLQGILALGAPAYHELSADPFLDVSFEDLFGEEIDWLGDRRITLGCDPPANDRFCPDDTVTRGQMAAFLTRALDLPPAPSQFTDTTDSVFEDDIGALAAADITRGCDPPANDRFCPDDTVTRGQMAAFLTRALDLPPAPSQFTDTTDSVFEDDIGALAAAGITRGCDPPANDRFCPDDTVTRGQMAAFLYRALTG